MNNTPKIMAILNLTPDSFYDGGKNNNLNLALKKVEQYISEGADIIDIGAYSSRPRAQHISTQEEIYRLLPTLKEINKNFNNLSISIDTFRSDVARQCVEEAGVNIINDISGGTMDVNMFNTIAQLPVTYILMHMQGTPQTMQQSIIDTNITTHIYTFFENQLKKLEQLDFYDVILDVGFGFGKSLEQNYNLLKNLNYFTSLKKPLLAGISRKSMLYKLLNISPKEALNATSVANTLAILGGAKYLRVHDVKSCLEVVNITQKYINS